MAAAGWSFLPADLLKEVSGRLSSDADLLHIHQVCPHWRASTSLPACRPWVVAVRGLQAWTAYRIPIGDYSLRLPRRGAQRMQVGAPPAGFPYCCGTSRGWLALVDSDRSPTRLVLWEPLSNMKISLPCPSPLTRIFVSDDPLISSNWFAIATQLKGSMGQKTLLWRPGDADWTMMYERGASLLGALHSRFRRGAPSVRAAQCPPRAFQQPGLVVLAAAVARCLPVPLLPRLRPYGHDQWTLPTARPLLAPVRVVLWAPAWTALIFRRGYPLPPVPIPLPRRRGPLSAVRTCVPIRIPVLPFLDLLLPYLCYNCCLQGMLSALALASIARKPAAKDVGQQVQAKPCKSWCRPIALQCVGPYVYEGSCGSIERSSTMLQRPTNTTSYFPMAEMFCLMCPSRSAEQCLNVHWNARLVFNQA